MAGHETLPVFKFAAIIVEADHVGALWLVTSDENALVS